MAENESESDRTGNTLHGKEKEFKSNDWVVVSEHRSFEAFADASVISKVNLWWHPCWFTG